MLVKMESAGSGGIDISNYQPVYLYIGDAVSETVNLTNPCDVVENTPYNYQNGYPARSLAAYTDSVFCKKGETKSFVDKYANTGTMTLSADGQTFSFTRGSTDGYSTFVLYSKQ